MSTVDPTLARKLREGRRPGATRIVVTLAVMTLGGFGLGLGWGSFSTFDGVNEPPIAMVPAIIGGMLLTIIGSIAWTGITVRRADVGFGYGTAAVLLGAAVGLTIAAAAAGFPPLAVTIVVVLAAVGLAFLILGIVAAARRRRGDDRDVRTMREGTLVTATVSDQGYDFFRTSPRILTTATFTFTDLHGTQRWVQRPVFIEHSDPIVNGQETRLWYDPRNPGDDRGIVVEAAHTRRRMR